MRLRQPYLHLVFIPVAFIFLVASGVPESAVAKAGLRTSYQFSNDSVSEPRLISARQDGIDLTASAQPWTTARMEAAEPYPIPIIDQLPDIPTNLNNVDKDPMLIPSIPPDTGHSDSSDGGDKSTLGDASNTGYDYPAPYTRFENFDNYQEFPYSTVGVLFFTQGGDDYRCSAAVVGENALWTAGHCVHDGKGEVSGWSENVVFIPAYEDGYEPFGRWTANNLYTRFYWFIGQDLRFDIGSVILEPNGLGQSVQEVVGSLGFAYNLGSSQHWFNFGYPTDAPFDGNTMQICAGSFGRYASGFTFPNPIGMGCDMTPGSSGGPWVINFSGSHGNSNYLNGNNSFRYIDPNLDEEIYSPYFEDAAWELFAEISPESIPLTKIHLPTIFFNFGGEVSTPPPQPTLTPSPTQPPFPDTVTCWISPSIIPGVSNTSLTFTAHFSPPMEGMGFDIGLFYPKYSGQHGCGVSDANGDGFASCQGWSGSVLPARETVTVVFRTSIGNCYATYKTQ